MKKLLTYIFLSLLLVACSQEDKTPEGALKTFVEARFEKVVSREFIAERVAGKMKESFDSLTDEDFLKFSDLRNVKKNSFKVLSKSCHDNKCFLTYLVSFNTNNQFNSEVKKIAEMVQVGEKWLIEDVSNLKTYHEANEPINPLE